MIYRILLQNFWKHDGWKYVVGIVLLFAINALLLYIPKLIGYAINILIDHGDGLTLLIGQLFLIVFFVMVLKYFSRYLILGSIRHMEYFLRKLIFGQALRIPVSYYEKHGPGKIMAIMTNDITSVRLAMGLGLFILVDAIFFGFFSFLIMSHEISYKLTLLTISPMFPIMAITLYLSKKMRKRQRIAQNSFSDVTEFVQELFLGINVIRAFNREAKAYKGFKKINAINYEKNMAVAVLDSIVGPLTFIAPFACYALNIYVSGRLVYLGEITVGTFVAMNGYLILLVAPLMGIGSLATVTQKGLASMDRIGDFLAISPEPLREEQGLLPHGTIEIKDLSFSYENTDYDALSHVSMTIPKGAFVGIVGGPGSGKSTLFKLLLGLQVCPKESIYINDKDLSTYPLEVIRRSMAYIPQQAHILHSTLKDNIDFGEIYNPLSSVDLATEMSAVDVALNERIKDEKSKLKEGGKDLSGGQKQRINIARAFYKNSDYILLDDAFSALDFNTAKDILTVIEGQRDKTILFISQRLEALCHAHVIYVFNDGKISEWGTHKELMEKGGEYYRLFTQQSKGGE